MIAPVLNAKSLQVEPILDRRFTSSDQHFRCRRPEVTRRILTKDSRAHNDLRNLMA